MNTNNFIRDEKGCLWEQNQVSQATAIMMASDAANTYAGWTPQQLCRFQMFQHRLAMPMGMFKKAMDDALGRPVYTHEIALSYKGLQEEFLGIKDAPSFEDIVNLIPEDKRIVIDFRKGDDE